MVFQLASVSLGIIVENLEKTISEAIATNSKIAQQVRDKRWHMLNCVFGLILLKRIRIDGAVLSFIDIADLKKYEEELSREEEKYRTLAETRPMLSQNSTKTYAIVTQTRS